MELQELRKQLEERKAYLLNVEWDYLKKIDDYSAGNPLRTVYWNFIRSFADRRSEVEMVLKMLPEAQPQTA